MNPSKSSGGDMIASLFREIVTDLVAMYPSEAPGFRRDLASFGQRVATEGSRWYAVVLPALGKAVDRSFETGQLDVPRGVKLIPRGRVPAFLQGLFEKIYMPQSGRLLDAPDVVAIRHLRQLLFLGYRYEIPYSKELEDKVLDNFQRTDVEIGEWDSGSAYPGVLAVARKLIGMVLEGFDPKDIIPRHGPGAVATGERMEEKWIFSRLYNAIHQVYPYYDYFVVGGARELGDRYGWYQRLERLQAGTAKVCLVPKDSRGPRLISCEPLEYQWIQQGLGRALVTWLETHHLSRGVVNFTDQTVNRRLALDSSVHKVHCTIDMKDASDRVSLELVRELFPQGILRYLEGCRTVATRLPNGKLVELKKFAPMGSALCFPVEALCFWALCAATVHLVGHVSLRLAARQCYVYGDDIVVPSMFYSDVCEALESCALRVNREKCFVEGSFRESCGIDAFNGVDVTPLKVRTLWSGNPRDASCYASYVSYANGLASRGYASASRYLFSEIEKVYGLVPYGTPRSSFPCREVDDALAAEILNLGIGGISVKHSERYNRREFRVKVVTNVTHDSSLDGWSRLLRNLNQGVGDLPSRVVASRATKIIYGWRPIF